MATTIAVVRGPEQGRGAFDGGRITERKPVGMPHEAARQKAVGPLFYWAWAASEAGGVIGLHPHQGFEIMSYVLQGEIRHRDTLGTERAVGAGGVQVMQTGSGVSHEEVVGAGAEFFQIWFQPDLQESLRRSPTYRDFQAEDFASTTSDGVEVRGIVGGKAPIQIVTDATFREIVIQPGAVHAVELAAGRGVVSVVVSGTGSLEAPEEGSETAVTAHDQLTVLAPEGCRLELRASNDGPLRYFEAEVPLEVSYHLYR